MTAPAPTDPRRYPRTAQDDAQAHLRSTRDAYRAAHHAHTQAARGVAANPHSIASHIAQRHAADDLQAATVALQHAAIVAVRLGAWTP